MNVLILHERLQFGYYVYVEYWQYQALEQRVSKSRWYCILLIHRKFLLKLRINFHHLSVFLLHSKKYVLTDEKVYCNLKYKNTYSAYNCFMA